MSVDDPSRRERRAALAVPLVQAATGALGALLLAPRFGFNALAFLAGAAVIAFGFLAFAWRTALVKRVASGGGVFARLLTGLLLKWSVIALGLALALAVSRDREILVVAGAIAAYFAYLICLPWLYR